MSDVGDGRRQLVGVEDRQDRPGSEDIATRVDWAGHGHVHPTLSVVVPEIDANIR